jgi:F0F1-type ATP synthase delta subunit
MCKGVAGGKDVMPDIVVDPTILGGCIVQIEDKYIDASVATQLTKLEVVLTDAV